MVVGGLVSRRGGKPSAAREDPSVTAAIERVDVFEGGELDIAPSTAITIGTLALNVLT